MQIGADINRDRAKTRMISGCKINRGTKKSRNRDIWLVDVKRFYVIGRYHWYLLILEGCGDSQAEFCRGCASTINCFEIYFFIFLINLSEKDEITMVFHLFHFIFKIQNSLILQNFDGFWILKIKWNRQLCHLFEIN